VHWLRKVLDEGHGIGGSDLTNKHRMASQLRAGSAWIMTGEEGVGGLRGRGCVCRWEAQGR
jgi:hypothetical protein